MADQIDEEIQKEIKANKILIYGKGTKTMPMCGFTRETMQFFDKYGYPYELVDVLSQPAKRDALTKLTNWPTLPKVFIDGQFFGDTDILDPMEAKGEVVPLLRRPSAPSSDTSSHSPELLMALPLSREWFRETSF